MKHFRIHVPVLFGLLGLTAALTAADKPKPATPAPKAPTKAPVGRGATPAAGRGATPGAGRGATPAAGRGATPAAGRGATPGAAGRGATPAAGRGATPGRGGAPAAHGPTNANNRPGGGHVPPGGHEFHGANGNHATFGRDGHPRDVHARGMDIHHGPGGQRTIIRERPGGVRVVSNRYGHGYIGHPYEYRGARFVNRTYYVNGVVYSRFYRPYSWGGVALDVYAPGLYYRPAFYGWAYNPWVTPIAYGGWGWAGNPWYGYYGAWFTPYPVYAGPAYWLTDYLVSQTLAAAYQERASELAAAQANFGAPMPPDVKNLVAEEVRRQLALENAEASGGAAQTPPDPGSSGIARMLTDNQPHIFVAANGLDVTSSNGECFVTEGDVLQLRGVVAPGQPANLTVMASKGQDCARGSLVQVQVSDLQDMQNHMRETLDQGLSDLQKKQGQGGIPAAPATAVAAPQQTAYAAIAPPPDPNVKTELASTTKEADQAEQEVLHEASTGGPSADGGSPAPAAAAPAPTKKIAIGQSVDEVTGIMGQPKDVVDMGAKQIYVYDGMKFTFVNGKLTEAK